MTERMFRIISGAGLLILLYISALDNNNELIKIYIGILLFEGITNWRIPKLISKLKKQSGTFPQTELNTLHPVHARYRINFEAERAIRLTVAVILMLPFLFPVAVFWIIPWFTASMLLLAGMSNICPMGLLFHWLGFK